jgi:uncharacterized protein DUF3653
VLPRRDAPPVPLRSLSIFHGYPAEIIAQWCGVALDTAHAYKAGRRAPSRAVMRLFTLHRDGRVLGARWKGWQLKADSIVDPDGNETSAVQLHNYALIVQYARHLAGENGEEARTEFYKLLSA